MYNAAKNVYTDQEVLFMAQALVENADSSVKSQRSKKGK